jgi:hypothetical protein
MMHRTYSARLATGFALTLAVAFGAVAQDLEEVKIELPEPYYGGTPLDYFGPNLEEPSYKKRDPFMAPAGTTNLAKGKPVTSSAESTNFGKLEQITDGLKEYQEKYLVELPIGHQWVQIDLGQPSEIHAIVLWHFHAAERVYFDVAIQLADDADFTENVRTIYNNDHDNSAGLGEGDDKEYIEKYEGRLVEAGGEVARYVRLYSKGNTTDDTNHYVEVDVYGKPAE